MLNLSRRDFVVSTAMAAALGLNARLAVSPAFAQKTPDLCAGLRTFAHMVAKSVESRFAPA